MSTSVERIFIGHLRVNAFKNYELTIKKQKQCRTRLYSYSFLLLPCPSLLRFARELATF